MKKNSQIQFLRQKDYKYIDDIGQGGTGRTILIEDELINESFVCKKYSPYYEEDKEIYYQYFKNEIKILHRINHNNIVRVFNYYLYPEETTGYILMEYVKGKSINEYLYENPDKVLDIFNQTIEGFKYLEENNILHRDIRPENILVSENGIVKIIDFGFGKQIDFGKKSKSISLNWRYNPPKDFQEKIYDFKTEIYFIGKLFEEIILNIENIKFRYSETISKMILVDHNKRIDSFFDIYREIISQETTDIEFSIYEKKAYQDFAECLMKIYSKKSDDVVYAKNIEQIIRDLDELYKNSTLENFIQNNASLTRIFIKGNYRLFPKTQFKVEILYSFIKLLKSISENKKKIVINNLWQRFDAIPLIIELNYNDDLPF
ncbi:protein kinase family protein [Flavobacterium sp.]|uniref:protein kinase family protein n=1 Tax=Flavobacterium sp. TaxID=239 RepID=UPI00404754C1